MTELERKVEACKCDVEAAKLRLQKAELELRNGERFLMEAREKFGGLKIAAELSKIDLRREQSWLVMAEAELSRGYAET